MLSNFTKGLELSDRLETDCLRILYYDLEKGYSDTYRSYEYSRLCTILDGEKHVRVNDSDHFTYGASQFLLLPPQSHVYMSMECPTHALVFELSDTLVESVAEHTAMEDHFNYEDLTQDSVLCAQESAAFREVFQKILHLLHSGGRDKKYILDVFAHELVYYLMQTKGAHQVLSVMPCHPVSRAIRFMKQSYASPVSIRQIAGELGMSEAAFSQYFKKVTGLSPKAFLTGIRMEKARELIAIASVTDAAMELGYDNISHFIALFKEHFGVTPGQYKKQLEEGHNI